MAYVFGVNMTNGAKLWDKRISDHPAALVTQSPTISKGAVYVGASSAEEALSYLPIYQCCTFRGSFSKLDIKTGKEFWRRYMVPEPPAGDNMTTWFSGKRSDEGYNDALCLYRTLFCCILPYNL